MDEKVLAQAVGDIRTELRLLTEEINKLSEYQRTFAASMRALNNEMKEMHFALAHGEEYYQELLKIEEELQKAKNLFANYGGLL